MFSKGSQAACLYCGSLAALNSSNLIMILKFSIIKAAIKHKTVRGQWAYIAWKKISLLKGSLWSAKNLMYWVCYFRGYLMWSCQASKSVGIYSVDM